MNQNDNQKPQEEVKKEEKTGQKQDKNKEVEMWKNNYLRALADYQNLERRTDEEIRRSYQEANKKLLLKFLDVLDDLEKGEMFVKDQGLKLIKDKFIKILASEGVKELAVGDKAFDPQTAECIEVVEGSKDNIVVAVLRKGYTLHGEILRVARVKVEKKPIKSL